MDSQGNVSAPLSYTISLQQETTTLPQLNLVYSGPSALAMGIILPGNGGKVYGGSGYGVFYDPYSFSCGYNTSPYGYSVTYVGVGDQFLANPVYPPLFSAQDYVPPAGVYTVILDYLSNCNQLNRSAPTGNTDYRVTANGTNQTVTFGGTLTPDQVESEIYQTPITLGTFSLGQVAPGGPSVQGRATYEDLKASLGNLNPSPMPLPIRDALVEVHRVSDDTLLASGSTDDNGEFIISFANSGTPGYYVAIKTQNPSGDTVVNQEVDDLSFQHFVVVEPNPNSILDGYAPNQVYEYKSQSYDETVTPKNAVTLDVAVNQNSGAFNIYDKGVSGFRFITSRLDASAPPRLTWGWMTGEDTVYCPGSSCYNNYAKVLSVRSDDTDTAEFMDSTLLHEFGHYYQFNYGSQSTPGGAHDFHNPETPTLAYAEGFATYFGQTVIGSPVYLNVYKDILQNPNDKVWLDLDLPLAAYSTGGPALGTQVPSLLTPGQPTEQTFNLSEALPAAAMWALTKEEGTVAVFEALGAMKTLTNISATNRDPQGFDFVDFLDSWSCIGLPLGSPFSIGVPGSGLHYILHSGLQFPYDYAAPCPP